MFSPRVFIFYSNWQPRPPNRHLTTGKTARVRKSRKTAIDAASSAAITIVTLSQEIIMLWTITIILFILWVVGLVSSYTLGGWIHILLVLAIIVLIFNLMSGRRAL